MELTVASLGGDRHQIMVRGHEIVVDQPVESGGEDAGPIPRTSSSHRWRRASRTTLAAGSAPAARDRRCAARGG